MSKQTGSKVSVTDKATGETKQGTVTNVDRLGDGKGYGFSHKEYTVRYDDGTTGTVRSNSINDSTEIREVVSPTKSE